MAVQVLTKAAAATKPCNETRSAVSNSTAPHISPHALAFKLQRMVGNHQIARLIQAKRLTCDHNGIALERAPSPRGRASVIGAFVPRRGTNEENGSDGDVEDGAARHQDQRSAEVLPAPPPPETPGRDAEPATPQEPGLAGPDIDTDRRSSDAGELAAPPARAPAPGPVLGDSPLASAAAAQARLIESDTQRSEALVLKIGAAQRQQVSGQLGGVRRSLSGFFAQAGASAQGFIVKKQAEVSAAVGAALGSVRAVVAGVFQAAESQRRDIGAAINSVVEGASASTRSTVEGVAGQIVGLINGVPLPNVPGVAQARAAAADLLRRAAGTVTAGLGAVLRVSGRRSMRG